jgi:hypothetical protein
MKSALASTMLSIAAATMIWSTPASAEILDLEAYGNDTVLPSCVTVGLATVSFSGLNTWVAAEYGLFGSQCAYGWPEGTITFTPPSGYQIKLVSFWLGGYGGNYMEAQISYGDGVQGNAFLGVANPVTSISPDFLGGVNRPVTLYMGPSSMPTGNMGLDNVVFEVIEAPKAGTVMCIQ